MKYLMIFSIVLLCLIYGGILPVSGAIGQTSYQSQVTDITSLGTDIPTTVTQGSALTITDKLINEGNSGTGPFTVTYYFSPDTELDSRSVQIGSQEIEGLEKGEKITARIFVNLPLTVQPGTYYLFKYIDEEQALPYEIRTNNIWYNNNPITVQAAQTSGYISPFPTSAPPVPVSPASMPGTLILSDVLYEPAGFIGEGYTPIATLYNGMSSMIPVTRITYYLSKNPVSAPKEKYLGDWNEMRVMPGESRTIQKVMKIPDRITPGYYYLTASLDAIGITGFRDYTWVSPQQIYIRYSPDAPLPDLFHQQFSVPDCANAGGTITVTNTIGNQGNICADDVVVMYYISRVSQYDNNALVIGQWNAGSICPGEQLTETLKLPIPDSYPFGTYYIIAVIDPCPDPCTGVLELDEENNIVMRQIKLSRCVFCS